MAFTSYGHYIIQAIFSVERRYDFTSFKRLTSLSFDATVIGTVRAIWYALHICLERFFHVFFVKKYFFKMFFHTEPLAQALSHFFALGPPMSLAIASISALNASASESLRTLGNSLHKNFTSSAKAFSEQQKVLS